MAHAETRPPHYLREWREHHGWTQDELAELSGLDRSLISKMETGKGRLMDYNLRKLANHLTAGDVSALFLPPPSQDDRRSELRILCHEVVANGLADTLISVARALLDSNRHKRAA